MAVRPTAASWTKTGIRLPLPNRLPANRFTKRTRPIASRSEPVACRVRRRRGEQVMSRGGREDGENESRREARDSSSRNTFGRRVLMSTFRPISFFDALLSPSLSLSISQSGLNYFATATAGTNSTASVVATSPLSFSTKTRAFVGPASPICGRVVVTRSPFHSLTWAGSENFSNCSST